MELIKLVQAFSNPFLDRFFQSVTMMGEDYFFMAVVTLILWCINKEFGYRMGFAYVSSAVINIALKEIFQIPRPAGEGIRSLRLETAVGYSFPSGHTQFAASFWTSLMIQIRRNWIYGVGVLSIILVAFSRIYLGVHTPVDVLGGMIIGIGWVFASNWIFDLAERTGKRTVFLVFIVLMLMGMFLFSNPYYFKVSGTVVGFFTGYLLEYKYIRYEVKAALWKQLVKYVVGMAVLLAIKSFIKALLPEALWSDFFRYFLMGLWVTFIAPYLFKQVLSQKIVAAGNSGKVVD